MCNCVFITESDFVAKETASVGVGDDYVYTAVIYIRPLEYYLKVIIGFSLATELLIVQAE